MTEQTNKITRESHPEIFEYIDKEDLWDFGDFLEMYHKKQDIMRVTGLVKLTLRETRDGKLLGDWCFHGEWSDTCGMIANPNELYRVEERDITVKRYIKLLDGSIINT